MREEQIANGVAFLTHPKIQEASQAEKINFLKNKGLTSEEIEEIQKRVEEQKENEVSPVENTVPPTMYQPPTPPPSSSWWSSYFVPGALAVTSSAAMYLFYQQNKGKFQQFQQQQRALMNMPGSLAPPQRPPPGLDGSQQALEVRPPGLDMRNPTPEKMITNQVNDNMFGRAPYDPSQIQNQDSGLKEISSSLKEINSSLRSLNRRMETIEKETREKMETPHLLANLNNVNGDVKAELRAMKTLLLASHMGSSNNSGEKQNVDGMLASMEAAEQQLNLMEQKKEEKRIVQEADPMDKLIKASKAPPAETKSEESKEENAEPEKSNEEILQEKLQKCRETLALMHRDNSAEKMKGAVQTLLLYLSNLISSWNAIPYGRISTNNPTYSKNLKEVKHHLEFLNACGFESNDSSSRPILQFTEEWRGAKDDWAEEVLKDAKKNLESIQKDLNETKPASVTTTSSNESSQVTSDNGLKPASESESKTLEASKKDTFESIMAKSASMIPSQPNPTIAAQPTSAIIPQPASNTPLVQNIDTSSAEFTSDTQARVNEPEKESASNDAPKKGDSESYPRSFFEISKLLEENGDWRPPDAKVIPNTLSEESKKFLQTNEAEAAEDPGIPKKPWEK